MSEPIFTAENASKQLKKLDELPDNEAHAGLVASAGDIGAEAAGRIDLGKKGAFVEGEASWMRRAGWSVAALIGWRKKS